MSPEQIEKIRQSVAQINRNREEYRSTMLAIHSLRQRADTLKYETSQLRAALPALAGVPEADPNDHWDAI